MVFKLDTSCYPVEYAKAPKFNETKTTREKNCGSLNLIYKIEQFDNKHNNLFPICKFKQTPWPQLIYNFIICIASSNGGNK